MDSEKNLNLVSSYFLERLIANGATSANFALFTNKEMKFFKSSDESWQDFYVHSEEAKHCHIRNHGVKLLNTKIETTTVVWDTLQINNDQSRVLTEMRIKNNRNNGISICQKIFDSSMLCIILTGDNDNDNFVQKVFENKKTLLNEATRLTTLYPLLK